MSIPCPRSPLGLLTYAVVAVGRIDGDIHRNRRACTRIADMPRNTEVTSNRRCDRVRGEDLEGMVRAGHVGSGKHPFFVGTKVPHHHCAVNDDFRRRLVREVVDTDQTCEVRILGFGDTRR